MFSFTYKNEYTEPRKSILNVTLNNPVLNEKSKAIAIQNLKLNTSSLPMLKYSSNWYVGIILASNSVGYPTQVSYVSEQSPAPTTDPQFYYSVDQFLQSINNALLSSYNNANTAVPGSLTTVPKFVFDPATQTIKLYYSVADFISASNKITINKGLFDLFGYAFPNLKLNLYTFNSGITNDYAYQILTEQAFNSTVAGTTQFPWNYNATEAKSPTDGLYRLASQQYPTPETMNQVSMITLNVGNSSIERTNAVLGNTRENNQIPIIINLIRDNASYQNRSVVYNAPFPVYIYRDRTNDYFQNFTLYLQYTIDGSVYNLDFLPGDSLNFVCVIEK